MIQQRCDIPLIAVHRKASQYRVCGEPRMSTPFANLRDQNRAGVLTWKLTGDLGVSTQAVTFEGDPDCGMVSQTNPNHAVSIAQFRHRAFAGMGPMDIRPSTCPNVSRQRRGRKGCQGDRDSAWRSRASELKFDPDPRRRLCLQPSERSAIR